ALLLGLFLLHPVVTMGGGPDMEFIEHKSQWDPWSDCGARVPGGNMYLNAGGFHYYLFDQERLQQLHEGTHSRHDESTGGPPVGNLIEGHYVSMNWSGTRPSEPRPFGKHERSEEHTSELQSRE